MTQDTAESAPQLKQALVEAADNKNDEGYHSDDVTKVLDAFLNSSVFVASSADPNSDDGANLLMVQDNEGNPLPVLFSTPEAAGEHQEQAPYVVETNGITLVQSLNQVGVVLDPMTEHQFLIPPEQMDTLRGFVEQQLGAAEQGAPDQGTSDQS